MTEYVLTGFGLAFAATIQPGPLQAFLLAQVTARGWKATLPAALAPLLSDGPIALLALLVLSRVPPAAVAVLRVAGGFFLLYLAWSTLRAWRRGPASDAQAENADKPRSLMKAATINLLNPNPYIGWTLVLGPAAVAAWEKAPRLAIALVVSFYATIVAGIVATIVLFGTATLAGGRLQRALMLVSAVALAALGVWQFVAVVRL
ncbi:MAG: LysE family translocator [Thermoanaerobaculia bacterium]